MILECARPRKRLDRANAEVLVHEIHRVAGPRTSDRQRQNEIPGGIPCRCQSRYPHCASFVRGLILLGGLRSCGRRTRNSARRSRLWRGGGQFHTDEARRITFSRGVRRALSYRLLKMIVQFRAPRVKQPPSVAGGIPAPDPGPAAVGPSNRFRGVRNGHIDSRELESGPKSGSPIWGPRSGFLPEAVRGGNVCFCRVIH